MRVEEYGIKQKIKIIKGLYGHLRKKCFNSKMGQIVVGIENLNSDGERVNAAAFRYMTNTPNNNKIVFDPYFFDFLARYRTERHQLYMLTQVLLHEMVHQYCYDNLIYARNHNFRWQGEAERHGLHSVYKDGEPVEEWLTDRALKAIAGLNMESFIRGLNYGKDSERNPY